MRRLGLDPIERVAPSEQLTWQKLATPRIPAESDEALLALTLRTQGFLAFAAGGRNQTFDLEVIEVPDRLRGYDHLPAEGLYEVKRLRQSSKNSYDRRFKTSGARGSRIYGRHSALIKAAALELEREVLDFELPPDLWLPGAHVALVEQFHQMLDGAIEDRHGHKFREDFDAFCRMSGLEHLQWVRLYLESPSLEEKIVSGYRDLDGLFVIRGDSYTLVRREVLTQHIEFDSYGCEGLKLRMKNPVVPRQTT